MRDLAWEAVDTRPTDPLVLAAYADIVADFRRALALTGAYEIAVQRALAGSPTDQVRAYLEGYLSGYLRAPAERVIRARSAFTSAYESGFEQGARDQLSAWGFRGDRFQLTSPSVHARAEHLAGGMASYAVGTLDERLLDQTARSAAVGERSPLLDVAALAAMSAFVLPHRGYNEGRGETAERSTPPNTELRKTWAVLGSALEPREHHAEIEGLSILEHDLFPVGNGVRWPHDWDFAGPEEWIGCRHFVEWHAPEGVHIEPWWGDDVTL